MKRSVVLFLTVLVVMSAVSAGAVVKVGDSFSVKDEPMVSSYSSYDPDAYSRSIRGTCGEIGWVNIMNLNGIMNGNNSFAFGEQAIVSTHGKITVIKVGSDRALCEYTTDVSTTGTGCPSGALFFLGKPEVTRLLTNYLKLMREEAAAKKAEEVALARERAIVQKLLLSPPKPPVLSKLELARLQANCLRLVQEETAAKKAQEAKLAKDRAIVTQLLATPAEPTPETNEDEAKPSSEADVSAQPKK